MKVIKRNGDIVEFEKTKITKAIKKAMKNSGLMYHEIARLISTDAVKEFGNQEYVTIEEIEEFVFGSLVHYGQVQTARAYETYRATQAFRRTSNTSDEAVLALISGEDEDLMNENSNKQASLISTQRDLIAGEVSKDIVRRKILPQHLVQAHDEGILHYHK